MAEARNIVLEICNDALDRLNVEQIEDLNDVQRKPARTCKRQYPICRDVVLRKGDWNFAVTRETLTSSKTHPKFGSAIQFQLPNDLVKIQRILGKDTERDLRSKPERGFLYVDFFAQNQYPQPEERVSDDPVVYSIDLLYLSNAVDTSLFDPMFKEGLACYMASKMAYPLTQSNTRARELLAESERLIAEGRTYNSQENPSTGIQWDLFDRARIAGHEIYPNPDFF